MMYSSSGGQGLYILTSATFFLFMKLLKTFFAATVSARADYKNIFDMEHQQSTVVLWASNSSIASPYVIP